MLPFLFVILFTKQASISTRFFVSKTSRCGKQYIRRAIQRSLSGVLQYADNETDSNNLHRNLIGNIK